MSRVDLAADFGPEELWRPVVRYEGVYSVSSLGRVRRDLRSKGTRVGAILKPYWSERDRVAKVAFSRGGAVEFARLEEVVAGAFLGTPPDNGWVEFKNDDRRDAALDNLRYFTPPHIPGEQWRPAPNWPEYEISDHGRARRLGTKHGVRTAPIRAPYPDKDGYQRVQLWRHGRGIPVKLHLLVALAFLGPRPVDRCEINHKNGNKLDPRLNNLEYATPQENLEHAVRNKLFPRGEACSAAKLTNEAVKEIKLALAHGEPIMRLARKHRVAGQTISDIFDRVTWREVWPDGVDAETLRQARLLRARHPVRKRDHYRQ